MKGVDEDVNRFLRRLTMPEAAPLPRTKRTIDDYRRSFESRVRAHRRLVEAGQAVDERYLPSDERDDEKDVAFGVTRSGRFLSADMVTDEEGNPVEKMGLVSHSALLVAAGLAKDLDDPKPTDDFRVRGIVKARLGGRVIFWEGGHELLRQRAAVRDAIEQLLARKLIDDDAGIYGAGESVPVAQAFEIVQDW